MKVGSRPGVQGFVNDIHEQKYASFNKEPLGRTIDRKYNMPPPVTSSDFKFGLPTEKNQFDVKETIYSGENMPEGEEVRQLYLKSHQDYDPGEQKKRPYDWKVDPSDFRFGMVAKNIIHNEMKQVMAPEANSDKFPKTQLIKSNLNDYFDRRDNKLGKPANLGQKQLGPDYVYGMRIEANEWDAGKCLRGEGTEYDVREDDDLGRCTRVGCRNIPKEGDQNRVFGVSTIRYDIKKPAQQSVADPNVENTLFRTMRTRQPQLSCCSRNSLLHSEWGRRTSTKCARRRRSTRSSQTSGSSSRGMCSRPFSSGPRSSRAPSSTESAAIPSRNPSTRCAGDPTTPS